LPVTSTGGGSARDWNVEPIDGIERRSLLSLVGVVIEIERLSLSVILAVNLEHRDRRCECPAFNSKPHLQAKVLIAFMIYWVMLNILVLLSAHTVTTRT
jgi:hypothetical protein